jgi:tetratricopeptide (TPR) repeat protein
VIGDLWVVYSPTAQHAKIIDVIPRVIDTLEKAQKQAEFFGGLSNVYSTLFSFYACSQAFLGNFKEAVKFCELGLQASAKIDSAITLGICEHVYGLVRLFKGDLSLAKPHLLIAIEHLEEAEFLLSLGHAWSWLGLAFTLAGEPDTGGKYAAKGLKIHEDAGIDYLRTIHYYVLGICHTYTGDATRAEEFFKTGIEISRQKNESFLGGALLIWLGRVLGKKHPPDGSEAMNHILNGIEISKALSQLPDLAVGNFFLGELYVMRGQEETAMAHLAKSMTMFEEMEMNYWLPEAQKILAKIQN